MMKEKAELQQQPLDDDEDKGPKSRVERMAAGVLGGWGGPLNPDSSALCGHWNTLCTANL